MSQQLTAPPAPSANAKGRARQGRLLSGPFGFVSGTVAFLFATLAVYPLSRVLIRLFWVDGDFNASALSQAMRSPGLGAILANTLTLVVTSSVLALLVGSMLAWLNERTDARMGTVTDLLPMVPFLLPPVAGAVGWVLLMAPRAGFINGTIRWMLEPFGISMSEGPLDIYSWYGLIWVFVIYQVPYVFLMVSAGLRNMDPSLEEQSRMSGASLKRTLRRITLPALGPSLGGAVLLMAWQGFALFSIPVIIGTPAGIDILAVRIVQLMSFTYPPNTDVAVGLSAILILFVGTTWYVQTRLLRSSRFTTLSGKGARIARIRLGKWRLPAQLLILGYVLMAAILPVAALLLVALNGFWTTTIDWWALDLDAFRRAVFEDMLTQRALRNSVVIGVVGASLGMVGAAMVSLRVLHGGIRAQALDGAIKLPAIISNVVIAVGFLLAFSGPPFQLGGSLIILGMAYVALYMPQGSVAADAAAAQVGRELPEASRASGAGAGRTFWRIYLPLMLPGLIAGWALLFARMAGDLTASAILSGTANPVVGYRILDVYTNGSYALMAALAFVLVAITSCVLLGVMWLTRRGAKWAPRT